MPLTLKTLTVDIPVAGTATQLTANDNLYASVIIITAASGNTNGIFWGDSNVSSTTGAELNAGASITLAIGEHVADDVIQLSSIWFDTDTNGNDVIVNYF